MARFLPVDYAIRNLGRSPTRLLLAVSGSALVVLLVVAAAGFVRGMGSSLAAAGADGNVVLLGAGSEESLERSEIAASVPGIVAATIPTIRRELGVAFVSPEIVFATEVELGGVTYTEDGPGSKRPFAAFRGIRDEAFLVHRQVRIIEGRAPGPDEIIAGKLAAARMGVPDDALAVGSTVSLDGRAFTIVGRFEAPGTVLEAELWSRLDDLKVATRRDKISCVVVSVEDDEAFDDVDLFTKQRLDLELVALREGEYYAKIFAFYQPVRWMVWLTAGLVAMGALLGGLNTMYAAFAARIRELATLQALGYSRTAIVVSLLQESVVGAAAGSLVGVVVALLLLDGLAVKISMGAFGLRIDAPVVAAGLAAGLVVGVIGALPPAIRCLGVPVASALRSG